MGIGLFISMYSNASSLELNGKYSVLHESHDSRSDASSPIPIKMINHGICGYLIATGMSLGA